MFVLPILIYTLLGAALSWAAHSPAKSRHVLSVPTMNLTAIRHARDQSVNCEGSEGCRSLSSYSRGLVFVALLISTVGDDDQYDNGKQIACSANICAFLQKSNGLTGRQLKKLAVYIAFYGCEVCGSVALDYEDIANGELTFNYVSHPKCDPTCPAPGL